MALAHDQPLGLGKRDLRRHCRHWRSYGTDRQGSPIAEPFAAFPSWFMRITCDRCGKDRMLNEAHMKRSDVPIRDIIARMRHDGCGGRAGEVELLTGIETASSPPVRRMCGSGPDRPGWLAVTRDCSDTFDLST